jgi:hypothetical protein
MASMASLRFKQPHQIFLTIRPESWNTLIFVQSSRNLSRQAGSWLLSRSCESSIVGILPVLDSLTLIRIVVNEPSALEPSLLASLRLSRLSCPYMLPLACGGLVSTHTVCSTPKRFIHGAFVPRLLERRGLQMVPLARLTCRLTFAVTGSSKILASSSNSVRCSSRQKRQ